MFTSIELDLHSTGTAREVPRITVCTTNLSVSWGRAIPVIIGGTAFMIMILPQQPNYPSRIPTYTTQTRAATAPNSPVTAMPQKTMKTITALAAET